MSASFYIPHRFPIMHFDHVHRAELFTFATGNTIILDSESFCTLIEIT